MYFWIHTNAYIYQYKHKDRVHCFNIKGSSIILLPASIPSVFVLTEKNISKGFKSIIFRVFFNSLVLSRLHSSYWFSIDFTSWSVTFHWFVHHLQGPLSTFSILTSFLPTTIHTQYATFLIEKDVLYSFKVYYTTSISLIWRNPFWYIFFDDNLIAPHTMYIYRNRGYFFQNPH